MLRVLRTLCHPLQQSRFMSGGAKRSSLNQRFHEIKIDSFFRYLDRWMDLSFYSDIFCNQPQILDLARKQSTALGPGSEGNELGCFSSTLLYFSVPLPHALRAPLALCSPLISSLEGSDGLRRSFPTKMERAVSHRDVDSFSAPNEMGN